MATELGRRGGIKGGRARAERLPPELRRAIAQRAAAMRWARARTGAEADRDERPRLDGVPVAAGIATVTLAGQPLQLARLMDGRLVVGQLSAEAALGEALAVDEAALMFHVPGEWQLRRGLLLPAFAALLAERATAGHGAALALLAACVAPGLAALAGEGMADG